MTGRRGAGSDGKEAPKKGAPVLAMVSAGNVYCVPGTLLSACFTFARKKKKSLALFPALTFIVPHLAGIGDMTPHL